MPVTDDYVEQYSLRERLRWVGIGLSLFGAVHLFWKHWGLARWDAFASNPHCYQLLGMEGVHLLFYGMFVGVPLTLALLGVLFGSRRGLRVLRDGQSPYKGEKVFQRTRIKRGGRARLIGWVQLLAPLGFLGIALWGMPTAHGLITTFSGEPAVRCEASPGIKAPD